MTRRRIILGVVLFVVAGATLNALIASSAVWFGPYTNCSPDHPSLRRLERRCRLFAAEFDLLYLGDSVCSWGVSGVVRSGFGREGAEMDDCDVIGMESGWPWRCFIGTLRIDRRPVPRGAGGFDGREEVTESTRALLVVGSDPSRRIPFEPIWPGFIANTLVYAASCWLLVAIPKRTRTAIRRRRGRCARCAYPVGESARCPECGTVVHRALVRDEPVGDGS